MGGEGAALPPALVALLEMDHISGFNHDGRAEGRGVYHGLHLGGFLVLLLSKGGLSARGHEVAHG